MASNDEDFVDYTTVTSWERFVAAVEQVLSCWITTGLGNLDLLPGSKTESIHGVLEIQVKLQHQLPFRNEAYLLTLHVPVSKQCSEEDSRQSSAAAAAPTSRLAHSRTETSIADSEAASAQFPAEKAQSDSCLSGHDQEYAVPVIDASEAADAELGEVFFDTSPAQDPTAPLPEGEQQDTGDSPGRSFTWQGRSAKGPAATVLQDNGWQGAHYYALQDRAHKLQAWFGLDTFLTLIPSSYSRRILNEQEGSTLRSALGVALAATGSPWPAFVPMHDPLRDAYWGVAATCQSSFAFLETDSVHISQLPPQLLRVDGLLSLFSQRLAAHAPLAAAATKAVIDDTSLASMALTAAGRPPEAYARHVAVSERHTYLIPIPLPPDVDSDDPSESEMDWREDWDHECSWRPWAVHPDPVGHLELDLVWENISAAAAAHGQATKPASASHWRVHVLDPAQAPSHAHRIFSLKSKEPERIHLRLLEEDCQRSQGPDEYAPKDTSFAGMLRALVAGSKAARVAKSMGQLASEEWWGRQGTHVPPMPPPSVLQDVLRDLFQAPTLPSSFTRAYLTPGRDGRKDAVDVDAGPGLGLPQLPGSAPLSSLAAHLALHALVFQSARAVAVLWLRLVRELRFAHWEAQELLPRMTRTANSGSASPSGQQQHNLHWRAIRHAQPPDAPDLAAGLLHQKLQMLNCCTFLRRHPEAAFVTAPAVATPESLPWAGIQAGAARRSIAPLAQEVGRLVRESTAAVAADQSEDAKESDTDYASCCDDLPSAADIDAAAADAAQSMEVDEAELYPSFELRLPSPVTSDMVAEREAALAALGEAGAAAKARMRGSVLLQAMQAFKAALPGSQLEDFQDWQEKVGASVGVPPDASAAKEAMEAVWQGAQPLAAAEQRPLWSAELEGERALHWLETLQPECAWAQLLASALNSAGALLARCKGAALPAAAEALSRLWQRGQSVLGHGEPSGADLAELIGALAWAERLVVVGEALLARLPGRPALAARLLDACLQPMAISPEPPAPAAHCPTHHTAGRSSAEERDGGKSNGAKGAGSRPEPVESTVPDARNSSSAGGVEAAGVDVKDAQDRALLVALMQKQTVSAGHEQDCASSQNESASEASSRATTARCSSSASEAGTQDWGPALQTVRVLHCEYGAGSACATPAAGDGKARARIWPDLEHQLYARLRPGELRIATVVLMES
ncbi:Rab3 GTPase-activating protein catalytic subunit [Coccomyxa sp. Obi]|nr:Rab3 GTPase-activating protein catalytic subunit [Coccomyxa sp. Obi]